MREPEEKDLGEAGNPMEEPKPPPGEGCESEAVVNCVIELLRCRFVSPECPAGRILLLPPGG